MLFIEKDHYWRFSTFFFPVAVLDRWSLQRYCQKHQLHWIQKRCQNCKSGSPPPPMFAPLIDADVLPCRLSLRVNCLTSSSTENCTPAARCYPCAMWYLTPWVPSNNMPCGSLCCWKTLKMSAIFMKIKSDSLTTWMKEWLVIALCGQLCDIFNNNKFSVIHLLYSLILPPHSS